MKRLITASLFLWCVAIMSAATADFAWAEPGEKAKLGLQHGSRGFFHLQEMVSKLNFTLKNAGPKLKQDVMQKALRHAEEALMHYLQALIIASEALGVLGENVEVPPPSLGIYQGYWPLPSPQNPLMHEGSHPEGSKKAMSPSKK